MSKETIHLLLVEDNPGDARLVCELLRHTPGFKITSVDRLALALDHVRAGGIDIVLLDLTLPDSDGLNTLSSVVGTDSFVPVVVLTGYGDEATGIAAVRAGAQDYLAKGQIGTELLSRVLRFAVERQQAKAKHDQLSMAISQAAEMVVITDMQGNIQYVNPAFEAVTGYAHDEVVGHNPRLLKSGVQDTEFYRKLWQTIRNGDTWRGRMVNKKKDGTLFTEEATISSVRDVNGTIVSFVAVKRDITRELNLEMRLSQSQKMEAVGRLAGGVAHDFNNMLQVVLGNIEIVLVQSTLPEKIQEKLDRAYDAAQRATDVTRQLLAFARKQLIAPKVLDLNDIVSASLKLLRRLIGEDINLAWIPGASLWPVKLDPSQLDQIIANLCINARDAIAGVGKITIETKNVYFEEATCPAIDGITPGRYVLLTVSDTGCGMNKDVLDHLFEPFFTTKEVGHGTGLGLATVYGIIRQNNGFIYVTSEPGNGSTFHIFFPCSELPAAEIQQVDTRKTPRGHGEVVLLVDDESALLAMVKDMLETLGYQVQIAATANEALRLAWQHLAKLDLLITDVVMPEMNGRDLAHQISAMNPRIKCLFMSGYTADIVAHRGVIEEDTNFMQKPFSLQQLASKVRAVLEQK